jgi:hypothetical protein
MLKPSLLLVLAIAGCRDTPRNDQPCACKPGNVSKVKRLHDDAPITGESLVGLLRRHQQQVAQGKNPRDIKVFDDELRFAISNFCQPCGDWVRDRMTIEDMFPLSRLDDATSAVCLGLVLRDGSTVYGDARPGNCRN